MPLRIWALPNDARQFLAPTPSTETVLYRRKSVRRDCPEGALRVAMCLLVLSGVAAGAFTPRPAASPPGSGGFDFSGWHFPVPAGQWLITRPPSGGARA